MYLDKELLPSGWGKIVDEANEKLETLMSANPMFELQTEQLKEKFGEITWYYTCSPQIANQVDAINDQLVKASQHTCEFCGNPAEYITKGGWITRRCYDCAELERLRYEEADGKLYTMDSIFNPIDRHPMDEQI